MLIIGSTLPNGATLLHKEEIGPEEWIVLAHNGGYHPYVVWHCDRDGHCFWGRYFERFGEAWKAFEAKVGLPIDE